MLGTQLHWVEGPWRGRLAMSARPRGGDWLSGEMQAWRHHGVDTVASLLEKQEELDLDLGTESTEAATHGIRFISFPIEDRNVPESQARLAGVLDLLHRDLMAGKNVVLHCRQGVGRTGLVAACLLVAEGLGVPDAIAQLRRARGLDVPETDEQRRWIDRYAQTLPLAR